MTEIIRITNLLRRTLSADAAACVLCGFLLSFGGAFLQNLSGLPASLMFYAGLSLFPFAAFLVYAAARKSIAKTAIWAVIGINLLWTIDSFLLLFSGAVAPTAFGYVFVISQAAGVLIFAALAFIAMRRAEVVVFKDAGETV